MNERQVKLVRIARMFDVTNKHTCTSLPVVAIGPRDALMAVAGWQGCWREGSRLVCKDWWVEVEGRGDRGGEWVE